MPKNPGMYLPNIPRHVIQWGENRETSFYSEEDYQYYLECLYDASQKYAVMVHAYVLMTNQFHMRLTPNKKESISLTIASQDIYGRPKEYGVKLRQTEIGIQLNLLTVFSCIHKGTSIMNNHSLIAIDLAKNISKCAFSAQAIKCFLTNNLIVKPYRSLWLINNRALSPWKRVTPVITGPVYFNHIDIRSSCYPLNMLNRFCAAIKNDRNDALAISEAARRSGTIGVPIKNLAQQV